MDVRSKLDPDYPDEWGFCEEGMRGENMILVEGLECTKAQVQKTFGPSRVFRVPRTK